MQVIRTQIQDMKCKIMKEELPNRNERKNLGIEKKQWQKNSETEIKKCYTSCTFASIQICIIVFLTFPLNIGRGFTQKRPPGVLGSGLLSPLYCRKKND